ncbi:hypothetical protein PDY_07150 [Photobacterium damselae subsp. damselae]|uniref:hypothetical protein n=1 Tax=Photobacterium damselae TaxID=38293 RepID=UPI0022021274|nr:hypothetical protein [Photobacterium damselae]BDR33667.1 hypothetical protein PDY_07150 [Photobacterium damselae subsp. damselae]
MIKKFPLFDSLKIQQDFVTSIFLKFLFLVLISTPLLLFIVSVTYYFSHNTFEIIKYSVLSAFISSLFVIIQAYLSITKSFVLLAISNFFQRIFLSLILILTVAIGFTNGNVYKLDFVASVFLLFFLFFIMYKKCFRLKITAPKTNYFCVFKELKHFFLTGFMHAINAAFGMVLIYFYSSSTDAGELALIQRFFMPLVLILSVVNNFTVSRYKEKNIIVVRLKY